jgi:hypothetical protein
MRLFVVSAVVAAAAAFSACEPCAGVASCRESTPRFALSGRVVDYASNAPVSGTALVFVRKGGPTLAADSIYAKTDGDGFFLFESSASDIGNVNGVLVVRPPGLPSYTIDTVNVATSRVSGEGSDIGRIVANPYIDFIGALLSRQNASGLESVTVKFVRTGGIKVVPESVVTETDRYGRFSLALQALSPGTVTGLLTVERKNGFPPRTTLPLSISTLYRATPNREVRTIRLGTVLLWAGEVYRRGDNSHREGLQVDFNRTGGIPATPATFSVFTNSIGLFPIQPIPQADGELVGDIAIHPPAPHSLVIARGVKVFTTNDDSVRLAGRWGYGAQVFGAIEFWYRTTMKPISAGPDVVFKRTGGGLADGADSSKAPANEFGRARIQLASLGSTTMTGDVIVRLPEPYGVDTIRNVSVLSREDDEQRFVGVYLVGRWFPQIAQVVDDATGKPVPGTSVTFKRTSGVAVAPDPYTITANPDGYFGIRPQPLGDGETVGQVTITAPGYQTMVVDGVRLQSSRSDATQFIGAWRIRKL